MNKLWINQHEYIELANETDAMKPALEEIASLAVHPTMEISSALLPNPDPVLVKEGLRIEVFESLENDPQVGTCIETRKLAVTGMEEGIEQGESPDAAFQLIEALYKDVLNTEDINDSMLDFRFNGYRVMEINWMLDATNKLVPSEIVPRDYEFFKFSPAGRLMFITKQVPTGVDTFQTYPNKFMLLRNRPSPKNPYGKAILSSVFWSVAFKRGGMKWWTLLMEKFGIPKVLIKHPPKMSTTDVRKMVAEAASVILDGVVAVPQGSEVELIENNITGAGDAHDTYIERQDGYISKRILGHTGSTDSTPGKLGNDNNADTAFGTRVASDARYIMAKHNEIIRTITTLNFGPTVAAPTYKLYNKENTDLLQLADIHTKVFALGYDIAEARLQADFGYDEGDLIKKAVDTSASQGGTQPVALAQPSTSAAEPHVELARSSTDATLTEQLIDAAEIDSNTLIAPLLKAVAKAKNYKEAEQVLLAAVLESGNAEQFQEQLAALMLFGNTAGRIAADQEGE